MRFEHGVGIAHRISRLHEPVSAGSKPVTLFIGADVFDQISQLR